MASASTVTDDGFPAIAGNLYARWTLDCLAELGYAISNDAISRPQLYQSEDIPDDLVALRMSYGTAPDFPNSMQRQAMMIPILGSSDGSAVSLAAGVSSQSSFQIARKKFVDACAAFAQQASDVEGRILEDRVRSAADTLRAHFHGVRGKSFRLSVQQIHAVSDVAIRILKSPGIAHVFGISHVDREWPLQSSDPNGAKLVEGVGTALSLSGDSRLTFTDFLLLQRIAQEGSQAIRVLLSTDRPSGDELTDLISRGYTWGSSLREAASGAQYSRPVAASTAARRRPAIPGVTQSGS